MLTLFKKKKKRKAHSIPAAPKAETYSPSPDFTRRPLYESHRAAQYTLYYRLKPETLLPELEEWMEEIPPEDVEVLDGIIFDIAREAIPDLENQRYEHTEALRRITARYQADRADFARILEERKKELAALEALHKHTCARLTKNTGEERAQ